MVIMGEPDYINLIIQTEGVVPTAVRAVGKVAIVGYSPNVGDTVTAGVPREHSSVSDINSTYGSTSALARSASLAIQNGANPVILVPVDATITNYDDGGTPGPDAFGDDASEVVLTEFPVFGSIIVAGGSVATPTPLYVEGPDPAVHDYIVDVGNKLVIFHNPSEIVAGEVAYKVYDHTDPSDLGTGLIALESWDANFVVMAYAMGDTDMLTGTYGSLQTHILSTSTTQKPRMGIAANAKGVNTLTLSAGLVNDRIALYHHNSYYDVAAIVAGVLSTLKPQESTVLKSVSGDVSIGNFTDTDYATFETNQINALVKHSLIPTPPYRITASFTLSTDPFKKYLDTMRVIDDSSFKIRAALTSPNLLGRVRLGTPSGMNKLRTILNVVLNGMLKDGEIHGYSFEIPGEEIVRKPVGDRTPEEVAVLAAYESSRTFEAVISVTYKGAVHALDPVQITYSGT